MAITPKESPQQECPMESPADVWERNIDAFFRSSKHRIMVNNRAHVRFTPTEVRKFTGENLPRLNRDIKWQLERRFESKGWSANFSDNIFRLSVLVSLP